jgi:hypothetical protein
MLAGKLLTQLCNASGIKVTPKSAVVQSNKAQKGQSKAGKVKAANAKSTNVKAANAKATNVKARAAKSG